MNTQSARKVGDGNPRTFEEASAFVSLVESLFMPWNVDGLLAGFTDDCVVRYAEFPEMKGKEELGKFFRSRSVRQPDFDIQKTCRMLMNDMIANSWNCTWTDAQTGKKMWGKGLEFFTMRDGKVAIWEGAFNFNEVGKRNTGIV